MANMFANGAVAIVAFAACVTPAFACAHEALMTDAEIAAYKNGGQLSGEVAPRMTEPRFSEPSKPDAFDDVIARAGSSLLAQADTATSPEIAPPAPATAPAPAPVPQAAPGREFAQAEPARKRVVITCSGGIYPQADVL